MVTFNDPSYSSQWHLFRIDVAPIWDEYTGAGVTVGVFDDGVDYAHQDLDDNFSAALNIVWNGTNWDPFPNVSTNAHGTAVAGIIAAEANNGAGGVGVAYGATLGAVDIFDDVYINGLSESAALAHMRNFDITSNSWGYTPLFQAFQNSSGFTQLANLAANYENSAEVGRGGLGTIIVQAAGNDALNAQGTGEHTIRWAISVAATGQTDWVTDYSNFGTNILIAAPAASVTTDISGAGGYSSGDYTSNFGGTSASTPVVSGVIALMLEANDTLGWRDVQTILAMSAAQTGSSYGGAGSGFEQGEWFANGAENWNGGGASFHMSYGYGLLDAHAAVRMAEAWIYMVDAPAMSWNEVTVSAANGTDVPIVDLGTSEVSVNVTQDVQIEYVNVTVTIEHSWASDMTVFLVSPDGQEYMLFDRSGGSTLTDLGWSWTFGISALQGTSSMGEWTVRVVDQAAGDVGVIQNVDIDFHGAAASANDIHHLTDDFLEMAAVDVSRSSISDTNGGIDWLNLAAVTGDVYVNMDSGIQVNGVSWASLSANQFENAVSGDGNDNLVGNSLSNELHGMRGNDTISAGNGDDTVYGGNGTDSLVGGSGNDTIYGGTDGADLRDEIYGGDGFDFIDAGFGNDLAYGGAGNDTILGGFGVDQLVGQAGNDVITGSAYSDLIFGGDGNDFINGGFGSDRVNGGNGADSFYHLGIQDHGSDWIQDYDSAEGDVLLIADDSLLASDFQVNYAETNGSGMAGTMEAFVIHKPTGQILWALVDGGAQAEINIRIGDDVFDIA